MSSIAAKEVAKEVLENIRKGKKLNLGDIIESKGYSKTTSTVPSLVTNTKSYQEEISPVIKSMEKERQMILERLPKVRNLAKYSELTHGIDILTKNIQLLNGGKTSNEGLEISWEK